MTVPLKTSQELMDEGDPFQVRVHELIVAYDMGIGEAICQARREFGYGRTKLYHEPETPVRQFREWSP